MLDVLTLIDPQIHCSPLDHVRQRADFADQSIPDGHSIISATVGVRRFDDHTAQFIAAEPFEIDGLTVTWTKAADPTQMPGRYYLVITAQTDHSDNIVWMDERGELPQLIVAP